jgi:hypothetical protein
MKFLTPVVCCSARNRGAATLAATFAARIEVPDNVVPEPNATAGIQTRSAAGLGRAL